MIGFLLSTFVVCMHVPLQASGGGRSEDSLWEPISLHLVDARDRLVGFGDLYRLNHLASPEVIILQNGQKYLGRLCWGDFTSSPHNQR